jgi:hypothetical protein
MKPSLSFQFKIQNSKFKIPQQSGGQFHNHPPARLEHPLNQIETDKIGTRW